MQTPNVFVAYAPRGVGLRCALGYLGGRDVYGWFAGPRADGGIAAEFFLIEDFHTSRPTRYSSVPTGELHSHWPLHEERRHELAQLHEALVREWLIDPGDARAPAELAAYGRNELALGELNLRFERLCRLSKLQPTWTYYSPHFERGVLRHLAKRWPLEYRFDQEISSTSLT